MQAITDLLRQQGATVVGFADLCAMPEEARWGLPRAVSFGMALTPAIVVEIMDGPTDEYVAEYHRLNALLTAMAQEAAELLAAERWQAHACRASGDADMTVIAAPFPHKTAARLAGHGWIGKCALLVNPDFGPAVRYNTLLTDAPLPTAVGTVPNGCGECSVCVEVCPGQAASGRNWEPGMAREEFFDARACIDGTKRISAEHRTSGPICGLCVARCPHTAAYLRRAGALPGG